jgi:hypothetical protein
VGDTLLPEIGLFLSLYVITRMLDSVVLAPDRQTKDGTVYTFATITTVAAGIVAVEVLVLVGRNVVARFVS